MVYQEVSMPETSAELRARADDLDRSAARSAFRMDRAVLRGLAGELRRRADAADNFQTLSQVAAPQSWWRRLISR